MIKYVIYSHTDYLDVLEIAADCLKDYKNKTLLINKSDSEHDIYSEFNEVIYYDDSLPYMGRLLAMEELSDEYILFIHDIDIVFEKDDGVIEKFVQIMKDRSIDRIDLQWRDWSPEGVVENPNTEVVKLDDIRLVKQENPNGFIYNVNPSIWKLESFLDVIRTFRHMDYRMIERNIGSNNAQIFCMKFDIYKVSTDRYNDYGYLRCNDIFQFFHITRYGKWFPVTGNQRACRKALDRYKDIYLKYNLKDSKRGFNNGIHPGWAGQPRS